ncbi:MAG: response regulator [Halobellus sp.]|uniref:response regulator n=1 Tax=Halobellus sp. TaxID=1979212 RepID=UPI0035D512E9
MTSRTQILYVDRDPESTDLVRTVLSHHSDRFEIYPVPTAVAAHQERQRGEVDCVVSECDLPEMNGIDFLSPISTVRGRLGVALETDDLTHVERAIEAIECVDEPRVGLAETLRSGDVVSATEPVRLTEIIADVTTT